MKANNAAWVSANTQRNAATKKAWRINNSERLSEMRSVYKSQNRAALSEKQMTYYYKNKDVLRQKSLEYIKRRYRNEPLFALRMLCRRRVLWALSKAGFEKKSPTSEMLGCTYEQLLEHLQKQFAEGMSWANRNKWHIDHKIPLASAKTEADLLRLCHYSNLQPLWALDNLKKGAKMPEQYEVER